MRIRICAVAVALLLMAALSSADEGAAIPDSAGKAGSNLVFGVRAILDGQDGSR